MASRRASSSLPAPEPFPLGFLPLQHPKLVPEPPSSARWLHELKYDGYRLQIAASGGDARIYSRNGVDWTHRFPELHAVAGILPPCVLDGELVALDDERKPNFSQLLASLRGRTAELHFYAFDQLWLAADDLRPRPLSARKEILASTLRPLLPHQDLVRLVMPLPQGGRAMLQAACEMQLEGIVSKRLDSPYSAGKRDSWTKAKCRPSQEVVIGGWLQEPGGSFSGLLVGVYDQLGQLAYAGSVKIGFSAATSKDLAARLSALEQEFSPFAGGAPLGRRSKALRWARPELVGAVEIAEWTAAGTLRQASFKGLREDKAPKSVTRELPRST